jgi:hypothetical protein
VTVKELVFKYGEPNRKLITDAITWLEGSEPEWNLEQPIDRDQFVFSLIQQKAKRE